MSGLTFVQKTRLEKLFGMKSGYVLGFTDRTFREFVLESTGKDIFDAAYDYQTGSKANRLRAFWLHESNLVVAQLISDLLSFMSEENPRVAESGLYRSCEAIAKGLRNGKGTQSPESPKEVKEGASAQFTSGTQRDPQSVFVVHGRNVAARNSIFSFLRAIGLKPIEWSQAVALTGKAAPYIGEVLDAAFDNAQAVVVLMSPDDEARLCEVYRHQSDPPYECELTGQARPNVLFEAGMAMGRDPRRTILVELGKLRPFSDVAGRHAVMLDNSSVARQNLAQRLQRAGCPVDLSGTDWHREGDFSPIQIGAAIDAGSSKRATSAKSEETVPTIDLNAIFTRLQRLCTNDDFYLQYEISSKSMKNARARFLPKRQRVIAFLDITEGDSGCDGVAFTESGIFWRNNHTEKRQALLWKELATLTVKEIDKDHVVLIGSQYIDLSESDVTATHLAKTLRGIISILQSSN